MKQFLLVPVLSLVPCTTRMTNMAIVNQHCMLAVWVVAAFLVVFCLVYTDSSTFVALPLSSYDDAFTVAFIWRFISLCHIVLHADTLSFHILF